MSGYELYIDFLYKRYSLRWMDLVLQIQKQRIVPMLIPYNPLDDFIFCIMDVSGHLNRFNIKLGQNHNHTGKYQNHQNPGNPESLFGMSLLFRCFLLIPVHSITRFIMFYFRILICLATDNTIPISISKNTSEVPP